ncbi:MAG: glycosyltransferase family 4 protein [Halofilum sp. (in: g-proteobacteria)]
MDAMTTARPRRVLMLCYYFPPVQTVAIARNVGFARELPEQGWEPTVLTVREARDSWSVRGQSAPVPTGVDIERTSEFDCDRLLSLLDGVASKTLRSALGRWRGHWFRDLCAPDPHHGWRVRRRGAQLADGCDCIYVSCSPFSSALAGAAIKRRSGRPLVLDFRDPWVLNPQAPQHTRFHDWISDRMERAALRAADCVILNTEGTLRLYREHYPEFADRFVCIPNGFDELNVRDGSESADEPFTVMHVGMLYLQRDPEPVLRALAELDLPDARFVQVGPTHPSIERYRDRVNIHVTGQVTPAEASEWMRSASLLYLNQGRRPGNPESVAVAAKTYEYLATGLPILADCPPGDNARMVDDYATYPYVITEPLHDLFLAALQDAYAHRGEREPAVHPEFASQFNRTALAGRLAMELEAVSRRQVQDDATAASRSLEAGNAR